MLGAAFLAPLAMRAGAFGLLRRKIVAVAVVAALDIALPAFLAAWVSGTSLRQWRAS